MQNRLSSVLWAWLGGLTGIGLIALLAEWLSDPARLLLIGSFGASAVLVYGAPSSPLAQPRNLLGGHLVSAFTGVVSMLLLSNWPVIAAAVAVATAIALMQLTETLHPPGGATALIAVIGGETIQTLGFLYLLPVVLGAAILLAVALVSNKLAGQPYPQRWF